MEASPPRSGAREPRLGSYVLPLSLFFAALAALLTWTAAEVPEPVDRGRTGTDSDRFSALEARDTLAYLLGDQKPHPMGSAANRAVKRRVIEKLDEAGTQVAEQRAMVCIRNVAHCGFVENVIGVLPGESPASIVLMAHYDSTTDAPGAGDDGAGVATIIEVMRALAREQRTLGRRFRNTVQAVITDGEEEGLFGAEAFFGQHPAREQVAVVINIEGSGTAGPSNLLRSSPGSGDLVKLYREAAPHPMASSIATEIFRRMPNDTDFSVAIRAGKKGLDFAFAAERPHYHSPLDRVENLDLGTLQHHGDNILPLMRALVERDLEEIDGEYSYTTMLDVWAMWRESLSLPLAILGTLLLVIGALGGRGSSSLGRSVLAVFGALVVLLATLGTTAFALLVAHRLAGATPSWPGTEWPWRLLVFSSAFMGWSLFGGPLARRLGFQAMRNGAWFWMAAMALLIAAVAPLAASPFLVPVLVAGAATLVAATIDRGGNSPVWVVATVVAALSSVVYLLGLVPLMIESQGYKLAPSFYVPLAFCLLTLTPALAFRRQGGASSGLGRLSQSGWVLAIAVGLLLVALVGVATTPLYTEWRQQPLALRYVQDLDLETARWWAIADGPLPPAFSDVAEFEHDDQVMPGRPNGGLVAEATWVPLPETLASAGEEESEETGGIPMARVVAREVREGVQRVTLHLQSRRAASILRLFVDRDAGLRNAWVAGFDAALREERPTGGTHESVTVYAVPPEGVEVVLELASSEPYEHLIMDVLQDLPPVAAALEAARKPFAAPVHSGDRWMAFERVRF